MLVKRAFETGGIVEDSETVLNASSKYRKGQDHIAAFVSERIIKTGNPKDKIGKRGVQEDFKRWFEETQGSRKIPKGEELYEFINKKFGQCKTTGWQGLQFVQPDEEEGDVMADL
jgi:phage/plasmid-associated DNA primase